jgi:hypothetical protein
LSVTCQYSSCGSTRPTVPFDVIGIGLAA